MRSYPLHRETQKVVDPSLENSFTDEGTHVVIYDELATAVIQGFKYKDDGYFYMEFPEPAKEFFDKFEFTDDAKSVLGSPQESFNDYIIMIRVIRRKSDGKLFGFEYQNSLGKYEDAEAIIANGEENGIEFDYPTEYWDASDKYYPEPFVFKPVQPFMVTGYQITENAE